MNLQEFNALKVGDKIDNPATGSKGEVVETSASGVRVVWGPRGENERKFFYAGLTTAWMQWDKAE